MQKKVNRLSLIALALFAVAIFIPRKVSAAEQAGTVGINAAQLYSEEQPNKRGVLVVRRVEQGSSAAEAGIHRPPSSRHDTSRRWSWEFDATRLRGECWLPIPVYLAEGPTGARHIGKQD